MMDELLRHLAASGPLGVVAAIAIYVAWKKDQQLQQLGERMREWQERLLERYHSMSAEVNKTVRALAESKRNDE